MQPSRLTPRCPGELVLPGGEKQLRHHFFPPGALQGGLAAPLGQKRSLLTGFRLGLPGNLNPLATPATPATLGGHLFAYLPFSLDRAFWGPALCQEVTTPP